MSLFFTLCAFALEHIRCCHRDQTVDPDDHISFYHLSVEIGCQGLLAFLVLAVFSSRAVQRSRSSRVLELEQGTSYHPVSESKQPSFALCCCYCTSSIDKSRHSIVQEAGLSIAGGYGNWSLGRRNRVSVDKNSCRKCSGKSKPPLGRRVLVVSAAKVRKTTGSRAVVYSLHHWHGRSLGSKGYLLQCKSSYARFESYCDENRKPRCCLWLVCKGTAAVKEPQEQQPG